ncbi:uncharacterized protein LOC129216588 [Uloborus diversus]|uniref:uncharacterized protein LOC129216588 n=1 Tax=Uloborus diversus TaxID=327109 RepID=UPI00240A7450|nr:uncharacterized protein LOC129216588 [Uloborus diversus]
MSTRSNAQKGRVVIKTIFDSKSKRVPKYIPVEDIVANIEAGLHKLPKDVSEDIRREASRFLQRANTPRSNIPAQERRALKQLKSNQDIVILAADEGNVTAVLNTEDYHDKIQELLDPDIYRSLTKDPTAKILRETNRLIKDSLIPPEIQRTIKKSEALPPRLYGLPKFHKSGVPLRPIVSAIGSPTYEVSKYIAGLLKPFIGLSSSFIKDSSDFVQKINLISLQPSDLLLSFDIVSLFTKVPVVDALQLITPLFPPDITALFKNVLTTTYFQWNTKFYEQRDGVAMGNPLSPVIANFYMEFFEQKALASTTKKPEIWFRYVDDTFAVWSQGEEDLQLFLQHLNSILPRIQFTMEKERNNQLPFLDVLETKKGRRDARPPSVPQAHTHRPLPS